MAFLLVFSGLATLGTVIVAVIVQAIYTVQLIIIRPYESRKDTFLEIMNENFFLMFLCWQLALNEKSDWNDTYTKVFLNLLVANNGLIVLIIFSKLSVF